MIKKFLAWLFPKEAIRTLHTGAPDYGSEMSSRVHKGFEQQFLPDIDTEPMDDRYMMRDGETLEQWLERMETYQ